MLDQCKARFRRAEDALRFFFRMRELLHGGRTTRLAADELPADACTALADALGDYRCIGWTMKQLDEFALWLLSEIYGPTSFGVHRRTFSHALKAARLAFPQRQMRPRELGLIHGRALGVVRRRLQELELIPGDRLQTVRSRRSCVDATPARTHLRGGQSAHRV